MNRVLRSSLISLMGALLSAPILSVALERPNVLPLVGTQVRVMAPALGSGWHYGEFNRLRVEPPCYRVLIFSTGPIRRIEHTLSAGEFTRIQVADHPSGEQAKSSAAVAAAGKNHDVTWRELSLELLLTAEKTCGVRGSR